MNESYNWDSEKYEANSANQKRWGREILSTIHFRGDERVLDIGCGDGILTKEIAEKVKNGEVVGIDSSMDMIRLASKKYPFPSHPNLYFRCMDARSLYFDKKFDLIFSNEALHWIKNHKPMVKSMANLLVRDGAVIVRMGSKGAAKELITVLDEIINRAPFKQYFTSFEFPFGFYGIEEYEEILGSCGLTPTKLFIHTKMMYHNGEEGLKNWIRTTWLPYTSLVPEEKREEFTETVSQSYLKIIPLNKDGLAEVAMKLIEVRAVK